MTVQELKAKLQEFPDSAEVLVSYSIPPQCRCTGYCYCSWEDREEHVSYLCPKEAVTKKNPRPKVKTVLICL